MDELPKYIFTMPEVAKILRIGKNDAYALVNSGVLKGLKLGSMKVTQAELLRFLEECSGKDLSDLGNICDLYPAAQSKTKTG